MSKNDWQNNDQITRSRANAPFFLTSGTADGSGNVTLYFSPGIMRLGHNSRPTYSSSSSIGPSFSFKPSANTDYVVYVRDDGTGAPQFLVSGGALATMIAKRISPPRYDAEPVAVVSVGASVTTANLTGPWNTLSDATTPLEQRGQYVGNISARPRVVFEQPQARITQTATGGSIFSGIANAVTAASGIAYASFDDITNYMSDERTLLRGTVVWMPSGALTSSVFATTPVFTIWRGEDGAIAGTPLAQFPDSRMYTIAQDPDSGARGTNQIHTTSFNLVASGTQIGYALGVYIDTSTPRSDVPTSIRIASVSFSAQPGVRASEHGD